MAAIIIGGGWCFLKQNLYRSSAFAHLSHGSVVCFLFHIGFISFSLYFYFLFLVNAKRIVLSPLLLHPNNPTYKYSLIITIIMIIAKEHKVTATIPTTDL